MFIYRFIHYERYKNFLNLKLDKNSVVLDFGANIGEITQCIQDLYNCKIYCYEPNNYAFKKLKKKFENNKKIILYNKAVGDKNGRANLYYHKLHDKNPIKFSTGSSLLEQKENIEKNYFQNTEIISIKDILNHFDFINLIKIDIEGYEYNILPEIIENRNKIDKVFCELHGSQERKNKFLNCKYLEIIKILNDIDPDKKWFKYHH
ncbi:FkbM family methyltransferase [Candidatus Pelagibacter sp.]|nr:FkbM family methyltransferase [Candidatus Pelagibacter sp.]